MYGALYKGAWVTPYLELGSLVDIDILWCDVLDRMQSL